jgi:hypothetical protein
VAVLGEIVEKGLADVACTRHRKRLLQARLKGA